MGLWQKIRSIFIREDEPSLDREDVPYVPLIPYPTAELDRQEDAENRPEDGAP